MYVPETMLAGPRPHQRIEVTVTLLTACTEKRSLKAPRARYCLYVKRLQFCSASCGRLAQHQIFLRMNRDTDRAHRPPADGRLDVFTFQSGSGSHCNHHHGPRQQKRCTGNKGEHRNWQTLAIPNFRHIKDMLRTVESCVVAWLTLSCPTSK
jgi:hypothetical protein